MLIINNVYFHLSLPVFLCHCEKSLTFVAEILIHSNHEKTFILSHMLPNGHLQPFRPNRRGRKHYPYPRIYFSPIAPMDDSEHNPDNRRPDPNRFGATIKGKDLFVKADTDMPARAEVRKENGALVASQDFIDETEISVPATGNYTIRISSGKTTVEGRFTAK